MHPALGLSATTRVLTVSQLNQSVRETLDASFDDVWVSGEISNFRMPASGHFYFALKDKRAQIAAVMFRSANLLLPFRPGDGMEVIVRGRVSVYDVRGDLQLYVETLEPRGVGSLRLALEQLTQRLAAEGLFAESRKRPLPFLPRTVGIITALNGAAIHDMLVVLGSRFRSTAVIVRGVRVQGADAPPDIVAALHDFAELGGIDVIVVGRGGGSVEDLWAFNDERVARAIAASPVPIVSAVGHEIDVTLADLVADRRAPTPTAAAALVVPDRAALQEELGQVAAHLQGALLRHIRRQREQISFRARQLRDPRQVLNASQLHVDELGERMTRAGKARLRLLREQLRSAAERLNALSPLAVLQRGYSIARHAATGTVVRDAANLSPGDQLRLLLARGSALVRVADTDAG